MEQKSEAPAALEKPSRPKKLLRRGALILLVLVLVVAFAGPSILGSWISGRIVTGLGERINGNVTLKDCAFHWPAHVVLGGLEIDDAQGATVLALDSADAVIDPLALLRGKVRARLRLDRPRLDVITTKDGDLNVAGLPRERPRSDEAEGGDEPLPELDLDFAMTNGRIRHVDAEGRELIFDEVRAEARLTALEEPLSFLVRLAGRGVGAMQVDGELRLFRDRRLDLSALAGELRYETKDLELAGALAPLGAAVDMNFISGRLSGSGRYTLAPGFVVRGGGRLDGQSILVKSRKLAEHPFRADRLAFVDRHDHDGDRRGHHELTLTIDQDLDCNLVADLLFDPGPDKSARIETLRSTGAPIEFDVKGELAGIDRPARFSAGLDLDVSYHAAKLPPTLKDALKRHGYALADSHFVGRFDLKSTGEMKLGGTLDAGALAILAEDRKSSTLEVDPLRATIAIDGGGEVGKNGYRVGLKSDEIRLRRFAAEGGTPLGGRLKGLDAQIRYAGLADGGSVLDGTTFDSAIGSMKLDGTLAGKADGASALRLRGDLDLAAAVRDLGSFLGLDELRLEGHARPDLNLLRNGDRQDLRGQLRLADLVARLPKSGGGAESVTQQEIELILDLGIDTAKGELQMGKTEIRSSALSGTLGGAIRDWKNRPEFAAFTGKFRYQPRELGILLAPWLPGRLEGKEPRDLEFKLDGRAEDADWFGLLAVGKGDGNLGLATLALSGFAIDGDLGLKLEKGHLVTDSKLGLNGGTLDVDGDVVFVDEAQARSVLDLKIGKAAGNRETSRLLGFLSPLLALDGGGGGGLVDALIDGELHASIDGPISKSMLIGTDGSSRLLEKLQGSGRIGFTNLAVGTTSLMGQLLSVMGVTDAVRDVSLEPIEFTIGGNRLSYAREFNMTIGNVATSWTGSIGFDRSLDLVWHVPVSAEMVRKHAFLQYFVSEPLAIPVKGTLSTPEIRFDEMLQSLAKQAITKGLESQAKGALGDKIPAPLKELAGENVPDPLKDVLGGALGGIFGGDAEKKAGDLLKKADDRFAAGKVDEARKLYKDLKAQYPKSKAYTGARDRVDARSR